MQLTKHFSLDEMTRSRIAVKYGINNTPTQKQVAKLQMLCSILLEPIRTLVGNKPVRITSGYRCDELNRNPEVGGSKTSQHRLAEAADIRVDGYTTQELFDLIVSSGLVFDQIIQEYNSWVHISFRPGRNRRSILYAWKNAEGRVIYSKYKPKSWPAPVDSQM